MLQVSHSPEFYLDGCADSRDDLIVALHDYRNPFDCRLQTTYFHIINYPPVTSPEGFARSQDLPHRLLQLLGKDCNHVSSCCFFLRQTRGEGIFIMMLTATLRNGSTSYGSHSAGTNNTASGGPI